MYYQSWGGEGGGDTEVDPGSGVEESKPTLSSVDEWRTGSGQISVSPVSLRKWSRLVQDRDKGRVSVSGVRGTGSSEKRRPER